MLTPRYYQQDAHDAVWDAIRGGARSTLAVLPTGAGKTPLIAMLCRTAIGWSGRVAVVSHVRELVDQSAKTLGRFLPPLTSIGVYSAGLKSREIGEQITVAGVQSVTRRAADLGRIDVLLIDEAHLIPPEGEGQYRTLIDALREINPNMRVIGLTATPYRLGFGMIAGEGRIFESTAYEIGVRKLIDEGFLSPLVSKAAKRAIDTSGVAKRGGEFVARDLERAADSGHLVGAAVAELLKSAHDRKSVLVFACGVEHAQHITDEIARQSGERAELITGETLTYERDDVVRAFKGGRLRWLVNVQVLTTGFDAPGVDCVALMRPTMSAGLYYQMVGRGFRLAPGKENCLVLDFGGNVERHGPVDAIEVSEPGEGGGPAPVKVCPTCGLCVHTSVRVCPECGHEYPREINVENAASETPILSEPPTCEKQWRKVQGVEYWRHEKRGDPNAPPTMRVVYQLGFSEYVSEWVCIEHIGYPARKARRWWADRSSEAFPPSVDVAVEIGQSGGIAAPLEIEVGQWSNKEWPEITDYRLAPKPPRLDSDDEPREPLPAALRADPFGDDRDPLEDCPF